MAKLDFDPYAVLGVARSATPDEIKAAYHELAAKYHPDRHQGNPLEELAAAKLAEINRAYEILSDPERRSACDADNLARPAGPSLHATGTTTPAGKRWLFLLGLVLIMPLLVRLVVFVVRTLIRAGSEGFAAARGTPLLLVLLLVLVVVAIFLLVRHRRR